MEWLDRINSALDYIEANLTEELDLAEIARKACCSSHHFQRMFSFITDVTLAEYIRRRRLTLAALELQNNHTIKVIDIALKYGYDSPTSFARAFQSIHGVTPAMARSNGVELKAFPRLSFLITIKGAEAMNYRIEAKEAFHLFGHEGIFRTDGSGETPAQVWQKYHENGTIAKLEEHAGDLPHFVSKDLYKVHAVCGYRDTEKDTFPYAICAFESTNSQTAGYDVISIPAHTWAIFPSEPFQWGQFDEVITELYRRVYSEWLPTSGYEQVHGAQLEIYGSKDGQEYIELWFAVSKGAASI